VIYDLEYEGLANYTYQCTDPYTNQTYDVTAFDVAEGMTLPDFYEDWRVDVFVDSAYGAANSTAYVYMPVYASNVSLSLDGLLNPGRGLTATFDGWLNAHGEPVYPDYAEARVFEYNCTCDDAGLCEFVPAGEYLAASNITDTVAFKLQKDPAANIAGLFFIATMGDYVAGTLAGVLNLSGSLQAELSAPSSATEGDSMELVLDVDWANGDPYEGLGNLTVSVGKPSGTQNMTLVENGNGTYSATVTADEAGVWNITSGITDAFNNTGHVSKIISINSRPAPPPSGGGGGGGGMYVAPSNASVTKKPEPAPEPKPAPVPQPVPQPEPQAEPERPESPTGFFAVGTGIASAIQSFVAAIVGFFAGLFGV
jgi:hypothetical protein